MANVFVWFAEYLGFATGSARQNESLSNQVTWTEPQVRFESPRGNASGGGTRGDEASHSPGAPRDDQPEVTLVPLTEPPTIAGPTRVEAGGDDFVRPAGASRTHFPDQLSRSAVLWAATSEHPAICTDSFQSADLRVTCVSVRGGFHVSSGVPREDAYAAVALGSGAVVLAVADGVSQARASRIAASAAANAAIVAIGASHATGAEWNDRVESAMERAISAIALQESHIGHRGDVDVLGPIDMKRRPRGHTTLALAEVSSTPGGVHVRWASLGDSGVLTLASDAESINYISDPEAGVEAGVPDQMSGEGIRGRVAKGQVSLPPGSWVILATDGAITEGIGEFNAEISGWLWASIDQSDRVADVSVEPDARSDGAFLADLLGRVVDSGFDDRTLVVAGPSRLQGNPSARGEPDGDSWALR